MRLYFRVKILGRRAAVLGFAAVLAAPLVCFAQSAVNTAGTVETSESNLSDWPRLLGPRFDGSATVAGEFDFSKPPAFLWSIELGDGYGIGSVAAGRFFQMDAGSGPADAGKLERQRCFDLESGQALWSQTQKIVYRDLLGYEDGPRSSPTVVGDRVYTLGVTGLLTCRDVQDGQQLWAVDTFSRYGVVQNFFGVASSPLVLGDRVIVMVGGSPASDQNFPPMRLDRVSPNGSAIVAFDRRSGKELWKCGDDLASYSSPIPATIDGTSMVLAFARSGLLAIDPERGIVLWQHPYRASILESVNAIVPVVDGNHVFLSECYELGSVLLQASKDSAKVLWQDPPRNRRLQSMRCHWATPVLVNGFLYGCSGRNGPDSDFRCIDFQTGQVQWADARRIRSSVTRLGDYLLVLEERGLFQVLKATPTQFQLIAQWDFSQSDGDRPAIGYPCWSAPVVVGRKLILRGTDRVLCLSLATGHSNVPPEP